MAKGVQAYNENGGNITAAGVAAGKAGLEEYGVIIELFIPL